MSKDKNPSLRSGQRVRRNESFLIAIGTKAG